MSDNPNREEFSSPIFGIDNRGLDNFRYAKSMASLAVGGDTIVEDSDVLLARIDDQSDIFLALVDDLASGTLIGEDWSSTGVLGPKQ